MKRYLVFCLIVIGATCFCGQSDGTKLYTQEDYKKEVEDLDKLIDTTKNKVGSEVFWKAFIESERQLAFLEKHKGSVTCFSCEQLSLSLFYGKIIPLYKKYYQEYFKQKNMQKKQ